ncbi:hypothetical protein GCM10008090_34420 [Arenicella chitinivorans]|uniref:HTH araC/xylS-type domain-containing protein n=1 Tax=Arenicella chitinivorans TaxID=1329800 RepID=A0A918S5G5_9GAMM|nr:helix-turn-helix domain-containing protein [Arenicella chitinivorans]GHA21615.1 hypothetical protein GCM10008090_34420 [Arenicella chitinivorans]
MSLAQTVILVIGGLQGLLLFTLLITDRRVNSAGKILAVQCLLIATIFFLPMIVFAGNSAFSWLIGVLLFLPACSGGLTYLYCRTALTDSGLRLGDAVHLLPLLLCCLLNYDILLSSERALEFVRVPQTTLLRHTLTQVVFYGQIVVYIVLLVRLVRRSQGQARKTLSAYNPDIFSWLWTLIGFTVLIWGLKVLFYFLMRESVAVTYAPTFNMLADFLLVVMVYFVAVMQWRNPALFHITQLELPSVTSLRVKPEADGVLDRETRAKVLNLVKQQVETQCLYRDSQLTLAALAEQVGVSVHQLSETLNQHDGKNFNQFINEYRVAEVCEQLGQPADRKLIDLALDAGFSSKSSFNAIFKKVTGVTPTQYRTQQI